MMSRRHHVLAALVDVTVVIVAVLEALAVAEAIVVDVDLVATVDSAETVADSVDVVETVVDADSAEIVAALVDVVETVAETVADADPADARTSMPRSKHLIPNHGTSCVPLFQTIHIHDV